MPDANPGVAEHTKELEKEAAPVEEGMNNPPSPQSEVVELPVGVSLEGVIHRQVQIKEMTGHEEEAISSAMQKGRRNLGISTTALLAGCCERVGTIDKASVSKQDWTNIFRQMTMPDRDFLVIQVRIVSFGEIVTQKMQCPSCTESFSTELDISTLEVKRLKENQVEPENFTFDLPKGITGRDGKTHKTVHFRIPSGLDQEQIGSIKGMNVAKQNTFAMAKCVSAIGDMKNPHPTMLQKMTSRDRMALSNAYKEQAPGPDMLMQTECPECGFEIERRMESDNFFTM